MYWWGKLVRFIQLCRQNKVHNMKLSRREFSRLMNWCLRLTDRTFKSYRKQDKQTYTEFTQEKEVLLDRWCASKEVALGFVKFRQMTLIYEFKECLPTTIEKYIEQKAEALQQAARLADKYSSTHHGVFEWPPNESNSASGPRPEPNKNANHMNKPSTRNQKRAVPPGPVCNYCKRRGHV